MRGYGAEGVILIVVDPVGAVGEGPDPVEPGSPFDYLLVVVSAYAWK